MKILMALMGLDIGGAETHVMELALELLRQGHQVVLTSNGGVYVEPLEAAGATHICIPMNQRSPLLMWRSLRRLYQVIQREQPDLVHAHARIPAFLCGLLQKRMHFPFITTAHGTFEVTRLLRIMTNWGDRTVAVSEDIKTYLTTQYQLPEDQIHMTVNGLNTQRFRPGLNALRLRRELGLGDGPVVMLVGRLDTSSTRSAECLIDAAPELLAAFPTVELVIVGGGTREAALRKIAKAMNTRCGREAVHLTGPRTDVAQVLSLCTVFVGVSRSALEAMSEEKPVILSGNPAYGQGYLGILTPDRFQEAQRSNFCCRGCPEATPEALARDVISLLRATEEERSALGAFGRTQVMAHYSVSRMTADYLAAYEELLHPKKPIQAVISGYYGYNNLGDDAILHAIARQLEGIPVRLTVLSRQPQETKRGYGLRAVSRFSPIAVFRAIRKSDFLISGGGSLLQDRTSTRSVRYYLAVIRLAQRLHKPVFLYANGIGPLSREKNRRRVCRCVEACDGVTLRDEDSLVELRALGVTREDIHVTADPAFTLTGDDRGLQRLAAQGVPTDRPMLGVSLRNVPGIALSQFAALCDKLIREQGKTLVFFVMQEPADRILSQQVMSMMEQTAYLASSPMDPEGMLSMLRCMDALVSMRLHTLIFAARERVPTVGCVYDPKVTAFLRMLGLPSCGTPENLDADGAYAVTAELLEHLPAYQETLDQRMSDLERQAQQTPVRLEALLGQWGLISE